MFDASTFKAWSVISRHSSWPIGLGVHCLDICGSSLCGLETASSSVPRVAGSSYVHWDWPIVPAAGRIRGIVLRISSLIGGSICIGISIVSLVVWNVVVSSISRVIGACRASEAPVVKRPWDELWPSHLSHLATFVTATGWKQLKTQRCKAKSLRRLRMSLE